MPEEEFPNPDQDQQASAPLPEEALPESAEQNPQLMNPDIIHPVDAPTGQVEDPQEAYEMAHAAKDTRDEAANMREAGIEPLAANMESYASRIEDWTGVLFNHPDIEALKEKYPGVEFTPEALAAAENSSEIQTNKNEELAELLLDPKHLPTEGLLFASERRGAFIPIDEIATQVDSDTDDIGNQWTKLVENPQTTMAQLRAFYAEKFTKYVLNPRKASASINAAFFEDVKRTAEPANTQPE